MYKLSIIMACIAISLFLVSCGVQESRNGMEARIMSVFRVDGEHVRLTQGTDGATDARAGMGLHEGHRVSTGWDSFCHINLDAASLVKMDMYTDISIGRLTDSLLRINIESGQVLVDVQGQSPDHVLEAIIGNTVISVRGTLFVAGVYDGGEAIIIVLEGSVYVNDMPLEAGYVMRVLDGTEMIYEVSPIVFDELDDFQLSAAADNWDRLAAAGAIDDPTPVAPYEPSDNGQDDDDVVQRHTQHAIGNIIQFGDYDWRVLDLRGNQALIITDMIIDIRWYHHTFDYVTWETSEIRQWLNGEFFARFSPEDQDRIAETYIVNDDNPWDFYGFDAAAYFFGIEWSIPEWIGWTNTSGGHNTLDRIFLLSIDEVLRYFGDSGMVARGATMGVDERYQDVYYDFLHWGFSDQYNEARIAGHPPMHWWLRSPGLNPRFAVGVDFHGNLDIGGGPVYFAYVDGAGIRPALWLNL